MFRTLVVCAGCLHVIGCAAESSAPRRTPRPIPVPGVEPAIRTESGAAHARCAADSPATWVGAEELHKGSALVFTTSEDVAALRARVSELSMPNALQSADPRLDNIRGGVRVVFEARETHDIPALRRAVSEHARTIARTCGLTLALRSHPHGETPRPAAASARVTPAPAPPIVIVGPAVKPKAEAKPKVKLDTKVKVAPPAPSALPAKPEPPNWVEPKPGDKPRMPRLPGAPPDPFFHREMHAPSRHTKPYSQLVLPTHSTQRDFMQ